MNRTDLQQLAAIRIAEATSLLAGTPPMPDGAYYLAGYAVECALKACIAKRTSQHDWPEKSYVNDCHTHNIMTLVRLAGLETARSIDSATNLALAANWIIVKDWHERSRYERHSVAKAAKMVSAVNDPANGVLTWIKAHW